MYILADGSYDFRMHALNPPSLPFETLFNMIWCVTKERAKNGPQAGANDNMIW